MKTLVSALNYIELVFAWSLAVGFGLAIAAIMGGPAYLNPGVVFGSIIYGGFGAVAFLELTLNSTGFSMNAMRSFFSSIWFAILPIPNKGKEKVDWSYQLIVNLIGSSIGGILAVIATGYIKSKM